MPWHEFRATEVPAHERDEFGEPAIRVTALRPLEPGAVVTLIDHKTPVRRRTISKALAIPLDDDRVELNYEGKVDEETHASIGIPGRFGHAAYENMTVYRQDVYSQKGDKLHGALYTTKDGIRPEPRFVAFGRSFYEGDSDPDALELFAELDRDQKARDEGRLLYDELASAGGISVGIEYEVPKKPSQIPSSQS